MSKDTLSYGYKARVALDLATAEARLRAELAALGFGILTEIDVAQTLSKKLGVSLRPYRILGACNPPFAFEALKAEPDVGLLLPCNLIVYQDEQLQTVIAAINPLEAMKGLDNPALAQVAAEVSARLKAAIERVAAIGVN